MFAEEIKWHNSNSDFIGTLELLQFNIYHTLIYFKLILGYSWSILY